MIDSGAIIQAQNQRAEEVRRAIKALGRGTRESTFVLADYLEEVIDNGYYQLWGYESFPKYVDASDLDIKSRQAEYIVKINRNSRKLGIAREQLLLVKMSKLKSIFRLDPEKFADDIRRLVKDAVNMSAEEVDAEIRKLLGEDTEEGEMTWRNFRVSKLGAEETIDPAVEECKMIHGADKMSDGLALERICATARAEFQAEVEQQLNEIEQMPSEGA